MGHIQDVFGGRTDRTLIHWMWKRRKEKIQDDCWVWGLSNLVDIGAIY